MATFVSAGVYIQEKDDSLYAPAISPTIIGLVGTATKGPLNEAVLVTNEGQLINTFGQPRTKDLGMHAAIEALKAARLVYFVRIAGASAASGFINLLDDGSVATPACIGPSANGEPYNLIGGSTESPVGTRTTQIDLDVDNTGGGLVNAVVTVSGVQAIVTSANTTPFDLNAIDSGNPVTLNVSIDGGPIQGIVFASTDPLISAFSAVTDAEAAAVLNDQLIGGEARVSGGAVIIASDRFGSGSTIQVTGGNANDLTNGFDFPVVVQSGSGEVSDLSAVTGAELAARVDAVTTTTTTTVGSSGEITICTATTGSDREIRINSATSPLVGASPLVNLTPLDSIVVGTDTSAAANTIRFTAATVGSHSSRLQVRISDSAQVAGATVVQVLDSSVLIETFDKLSKGATVTGTTDLVDTINNGNSEFAASDLVVASDLNPSATEPANGTFQLSTGDDGDDWTAGSVIGAITAGIPSGMQIFRSVDDIFVNVFATPGISYASVISEGLDICSTRGDCIFVADAPRNLNPQDAVAWHNGDSTIGPVVVDQENRTETNSTLFNSSYGAMYYPYLTTFDKFNDQNITIAPSSIILRTYAFTDQVSDPWFAPAGPNRTQALSILGLEFNPTLGERDLMQGPGNNLNPIANIDGVGVIIMGQKTLQRAPTALDRVNVRRLLLAVEKVVSQAVFFLTFEPNDSMMWRRFVNLVTPIFEDVKARRGLFDFRVIADSSTTTPALIDQNTFLGKIFLQPTKAAEILIVSFNLVPTGANFEEFAKQ